MVHALAESWRVLRVGERMVDLRPMASGWPVEIVSRDAQTLVGRVDDQMRTVVDNISNEAVAETVRRGWFEKESEDRFEFAYYWDTVDAMSTYVETEWGYDAFLPENVLSEAHRLVKEADEGVQIRVRRTMLIASYRKPAG
jgi:hypothetical protein